MAIKVTATSVTVRDMPSTRSAFNTLPIEINKMIAHNIEQPKDLVNFMLVCKTTRDAVDGDYCSFWHAKFATDFDKALDPKDRKWWKKLNRDFRWGYKWRVGWMRRFMDRRDKLRFAYGFTDAEEIMIQILEQLIAQTFGGNYKPSDNGELSHNMLRLKEFAFRSAILLGGKRPPPLAADQKIHYCNPLDAVKLMLSHFVLDLNKPTGSSFALDEVHEMVYQPVQIHPMFVGPERLEVNMHLLFNCMQLFRYHMTVPQASLFNEVMSNLDTSQKPKPWTSKLKPEGQPLAKHWKGTYAYLSGEDLDYFRSFWGNNQDAPAHEIPNDMFVGEGEIQTLHLEYSDEDRPWPPVFEQALNSLGGRTEIHEDITCGGLHDISAFRNIRFNGRGVESKCDFLSDGWLNPLPCQFGISGWQRITFMKHYQSNLKSIKQDNWWAYEGVVLPGGKVMLGRWWYAADEHGEFQNSDSGPFIFWAVDEEIEQHIMDTENDADSEDNGLESEDEDEPVVLNNEPSCDSNNAADQPTATSNDADHDANEQL